MKHTSQFVKNTGNGTYFPVPLKNVGIYFPVPKKTGFGGYFPVLYKNTKKSYFHVFECSADPIKLVGL